MKISPAFQGMCILASMTILCGVFAVWFYNQAFFNATIVFSIITAILFLFTAHTTRIYWERERKVGQVN